MVELRAVLAPDEALADRGHGVGEGGLAGLGGAGGTALPEVAVLSLTFGGGAR